MDNDCKDEHALAQHQEPEAVSGQMRKREHQRRSKRVSLNEGMNLKKALEGSTAKSDAETKQHAENLGKRLKGLYQACYGLLDKMTRVGAHKAKGLAEFLQLTQKLTMDKLKGGGQPSSTVLEVEMILLSLLQILRRVEIHEPSSNDEFVVSFVMMDGERSRINELCHNMALLFQQQDEPLAPKVDQLVLANDTKDAEAESKVFRDLMAKGEGNEVEKNEKRQLLELLKASDKVERPNLPVMDLSRVNAFPVHHLVKSIATAASNRLYKAVAIRDATFEATAQDTFSFGGVEMIMNGTFPFLSKTVHILSPFAAESGATNTNNNNSSKGIKFSNFSLKDRVEMYQEILRWKSLNHQNIYRFFGSLYQDKELLSAPRPILQLIYEPMDLTLFELLYNERRPLFKNQLGTIIRGIARGLAFLHEECAIVHRNITTHSILLSYDLGVKIAGFGFTWLADGEQVQALENYQYLAPESLNGARNRWSFGSDIYAMACVLFELTHGVPPFGVDAQYLDVLNAVCRENKRPTVLKDSGLPEPWFEDLLKTCWDKDPLSRPSASKFLNVVTKNTASTARASRRIVQGMLDFLSKRTTIDPRQHVQTIVRETNADAPALNWNALTEALTALVQQSEKQKAKAGGGEWYFRKLWELDGAKAVVAAGLKHYKNAHVAEACCRLMRFMGRSHFEPYFSERQSKILIEYEGHKVLSSIFETHRDSAMIMVHSCGATKSLASSGSDFMANDARRRVLVEGMMITHLLDVLDLHRSDLDVVRVACGALQNICLYEHAISDKSAALIPPAMIDLFTEEHENVAITNPSLMRKVCGTLRNVSFKDENARLLVDDASITFLLDALKVHMDDENILNSVLATLWNLTFCEPTITTKLLNTTRVVSSGGQDFLQTLNSIAREHFKNLQLLANLISLVDNLAWLDENRETVVQRGWHDLILGIMQKHPTNVGIWESGFSSLRSLSMADSFEEQNLNMESIDRLLEGLVEHFIQEVPLVRNGLLYLLNISCHDKPLLQICEKPRSSAWVLRCMTAHPLNADIQDVGCGILCNLATPISNKANLYQSSVVHWIEKAMLEHSDNFNLQLNGARCLLRLGENAENLKLMNREGSRIPGLIKSVAVRFPKSLEYADFDDYEERFPIDPESCENCSICLEPLYLQKMTQPFSCKHVFHEKCAGKWCKLQQSCPLCRSAMKSDFEIPDHISDVDPRYEEDEALLQPFLNENGNDFEILDATNFINAAAAELGAMAALDANESGGDDTGDDDDDEEEAEEGDLDLDLDDDPIDDEEFFQMLDTTISEITSRIQAIESGSDDPGLALSQVMESMSREFAEAYRNPNNHRRDEEQDGDNANSDA